MKSPIEMMLDGVQWVESELKPKMVGGNFSDSGDLPYVTHSGVLNIGGLELRCYRLSDGSAIFNAEDIEKMFGGTGVKEVEEILKKKKRFFE